MRKRTRAPNSESIAQLFSQNIIRYSHTNPESQTHILNPKPGGEDVPLGEAADMHKRIRDYHIFVHSNMALLAKQPRSLFVLARAAPRGSAVLVDCVAVMERAERTTAYVNSLVDPMKAVHDATDLAAKLLIAKSHLEVVMEQGIADALGGAGPDRVEVAIVKASHKLEDIKVEARTGEKGQVLGFRAERFGVLVCLWVWFLGSAVS